MADAVTRLEEGIVETGILHVLDTAAQRTTTFSWNQDYAPLTWPRDGRELLRVKARLPAYWKAANLDVYQPERINVATLERFATAVVDLETMQTF